MSESGDTDLLISIPPDFFFVPSESDDSDFCGREGYSSHSTGVVSELIEHVQSLESRITAIESKDNSLDLSVVSNSLDLHPRLSYHSPHKCRSSLTGNRFSVSQSSSLQNTPLKPRLCSSVPSTPSSYQPSSCTNQIQNEGQLTRHLLTDGSTNISNTNPRTWSKHGNVLTSLSEASFVHSPARNLGFLHAATTLSEREPCSTLASDRGESTVSLCIEPCEQLSHMTSTSKLLRPLVGQFYSEAKPVSEMELSEVNQLLQEMEAKEMDLAERIDNVLHECCQGQTRTDRSERNGNIHHFKELEASQKVGSPKRRLNLQFYNVESSDKSTPALNDLNQSVDKLADLSFAHDSLNLHEMDKLASDLNGGQNSTCSVLPQTKEYVGELSQTKSSGKKNGDSISKELDMQTILTNCKESMAKEALGFRDQEGTTYCPRNVYTKVQQGLGSANSEFSKSQVPPQPKHRDVATEYFPQTCRNVDSTSNVQSTFNEMHLIHPFRNTSHVATNTEPCLRKSQHLLALSDFWENNESKTQEEMLSIKLEEEKFRREHCENLIQELQKRLLEQQEKVAVAIRVDNEKNAAICQFQSSWSKLKLRWQALETEHKSLQDVLKNITEKHQTEVSEFQAQIKRNEGELSKALDLAAGYKEKSDNMIKEKVELLKSHADELENYKSMVQEVENRYERMKTEYTKILDKNQQLDETVKNVQQELHRERLRGGEVRSEMAVIHKALDACEAELTVLRQEKENLQLKVKEELNRNNILEQNKVSFLVAVDEARKAERMAKEESKSLLEQQEKIRTELREVYQTQVDEVVKAKLQEFQAQLDAAEGAFQVELETRQRAIAECAARKIKSVIDKHNLEINLLEEKHKEEKRLCEIQLAQSMQQSSMLEAQLNTQKATKSRVVEQLHSVMQKQWQQALQIISGGNVENLSPVLRLNAEKFLESRDIKKFDSITGCCGKAHPEPMRLESQSVGNFQQIQSRESYDEGLISMPCTDDTPLTSRKESKDDLRRYIKMILDMQQSKDEFMTRKTSEDCCSPTPIYREVPRKHYIKKELSMMSEDSITWQPTPDDSLKNTDELLSVPQRLTSKVDQQKSKPPWK